MIEIQQFLKNIEPFLVLLSTLFGITVIGFVIKLTLFMKEALSQRVEALKDKQAVTEERRQKELEDRVRAEKERDELKQKLSTILEQEYVTVESLVANPALNTIKQEVTDALLNVLREMRQVETKIVSTEDNPKDHLELAKASTVAGDWQSAAKHYEEYVQVYPDNWEIHFLRAVAYANIRGGRTTDLASLRAYNDAIAFAPDKLDLNILARIHTYHGAILKRLGRLDEALCELLLAQKWASKSYEVVDNQYNLACVYALRKEKGKMMQCLKKLSLAPSYKHKVRNSPYFNNYRNDEDFLDWLD